MLKKSVVLLLISTIIMTTFLVGCGSQQSVDVETDLDTNQEDILGEDAMYPGFERGNVLTVGGTSLEGIFNPLTYSSVYDWYIIELMFDPLLQVTPEGALTTEGSLTKDYEISDDRLTYTFHLRDNVKWHDGTDFTAEDVVFSYHTIFAPDYKGRSYNAVLQRVVGAQDVKNGNAEIAEGIKALDDYTVEVTVTEAMVKTLNDLAITPIPKHYYDKATADEIAGLDRDPLGNGPFKLRNYEVEQYVDLEPNIEYWQGSPKLNGIIWKVVARQNELSEFEIGAIDAVNFENTIENYEIIEEYDHGQLLNNWNNGYTFASFNFRNPIFQDKNVRQALTYGLNRDGFVKSFFGDLGGEVAHTPISPVSWAYPDQSQLNEYEYNPDKANELLDEAGWEISDDGYRYKDGEKLAFTWTTYNEAEWSTQITALAAENWKQIGVECIIELMDFNSLSELISDPSNSDKWDMYNMAWVLTEDPDMYSTFSRTTFPPGNNRGCFENDEIEELMLKGLYEFDQKARKDIYQELAVMFNEELPYIFVYTRMNPWLVNKRVKNFNPTEFTYWSKGAHLIEIVE